METKAPTVTARAVVVERDDGRHAARVVAVSLGILFAFIFLLQAATDSEARHDGADPAITADKGRGAGALKPGPPHVSYHLRDLISDSKSGKARP
jgi:hypothetical protein